MYIPTYHDIKKAHKRIQNHIVTTPLLRQTQLDEELHSRIFLKLESVQKTGSFKLRGAMNKLLCIKEQLDKRHVTPSSVSIVACSSGNHAQAIAYASTVLGFSATIVMPHDAPTIKIEKTRAYGAEIVLYDRLTEIREDIAKEICQKKQGIFVHPFDDPDVIAGQGTAGLEIVADIKTMHATIDCVIVPASGGGLASGISIAIKSCYPQADIYVVEPEGYDSMAISIEQQAITSLAPSHMSICDALMAKTSGELPYTINRQYASKFATVDDEAIKNAVKKAFYDLKLVIEPGGGAALACLLSSSLKEKYTNIVILISGGNIDSRLLYEIVG